MTFTYAIKKVDFLQDKAEDKGLIDLDGAIKVFQDFPFAEELKKADGYEHAEILPTIVYKNEKGDQLTVWAMDLEGFMVEFNNEKQLGLLQVVDDYESNPQGLVTENYIDAFFNNNIHSLIPIKEKTADDLEEEEIDKRILHEEEEERKAIESQGVLEYGVTRLKTLKHITNTLLLMVACIVISVISLTRFSEPLFVPLLFNLLWVPGLLLYLNHSKKSKGVKLTVDCKTQTLTYTSPQDHMRFTRNEVSECHIVQSGSDKSQYDYTHFVLKNGREVFVSSLVVSAFELTTNIQVRTDSSSKMLPLMPGKQVV